MLEKPKKSGIPTAFDLTNLALRGLGKGLGAIAKAGGNVLRNANDKQHLELALDVIEPIMFAGGATLRWLPGTTRPPLRATSLSGDEIDRFNIAYRQLVSRGIPLPRHVANFASTHRLG